ncbi:CADH8 protein, partial [Amia calva]|nr:CADH8 protein [Amia calva]
MKPGKGNIQSFLGILTLLLSLWEMGQTEWSSSGSQPQPHSSGSVLRREKRSWVWNQFFVLEEYTGNDPLYVGKLHSDVDKGDGDIKYVLSGEGATSIFIIDENTGDIHATKRLDREEQAYYTLRAQAVDRLTNRPVEPESEFVVKIQDINDNEPKFLDGPYTAGVPEMSPVGTSVVQVTATDADDPTYGNSARVVYSILQGQPYFSVEPKTALGLVFFRFSCDLAGSCLMQQHTLTAAYVCLVDKIGTTCTVFLNRNIRNITKFTNERRPFDPSIFHLTLKKILLFFLSIGIIRTALPNMDREAKDQYLLVIQAKDMVGQMGGLSGTTSVTVTLTDVNDNPPRFSRITMDTISMNVGLLFCFMDLQDWGCLGLDFETKASYTLRIEATNKKNDPQFLNLGPFSDTTTVKVNVEDVDEPPVFTSLLNRMVVSEAAKVGTIIGTVSAHDPDASNSAIRYSIDRNTDLERFFNIDAMTGVISTAKQLDREQNAVHNITIFAMESKDPTQVGKGIAIITVMDINDNAPVFAIEYETFLCENARPGQVIQTISAVDKDEPPSGHRFFFALTPEAASNLNFTLRDNKDNTASILTKRNGFRRQEQSLYKLPILIVDSGSPSLSSTNTLTIRVCDCDPEGIAQSCNAEAYVLPAGLSTGALIAILACVLTLLGPDTGHPLLFARVSSVIQQGRHQSHFTGTLLNAKHGSGVGVIARTTEVTLQSQVKEKHLLVLLIVTMRRRKKEPLIFDEERDIRENIVRYDDEGGGEEDTEAFDMVALRNLNVMRDTKARRDVTPEVQFFSRPTFKTLPDNVIFREFIWERLKEADIDPSAPPYDSLQTYAFEGNGSVAESLSSLESLSTDSDQNYDYLSDWGPRFKKLADLYGNSESNIFS